MDLILVESPTKSKTLKKFLGDDYKILPTKGHIRDLPENSLGVDVENSFQPKYVVPNRQKKTIKKLKKEIEKADRVILSTDPDREGEAISWHLKKALDLEDYTRATFHQITEEAIKEALENPTDLDKDLVNAQQARRVLDRLVGYKLSPFLWKKVTQGLSAGRVQSVALRFITDKEKEIEDFDPETYWLVYAHLQNGEGFRSKLVKINGENIPKPGLKDKENFETTTKQLQKADYQLVEFNRKQKKKSPYPPYTTSSLQQDAWHRLNYPAKFTMSLAQSLYEKGLITYHRTDSTNLSQSSKKQAGKIIKNKWSDKYHKPRNFQSSGRTQEAHEAIRPTDATKANIKGKKELKKLYELIRSRFLASQMASIQLEKQKAEIKAEAERNYLLRAHGQNILFDGFLKVYNIKNLKRDPLPDLEDEDLTLDELETEEKETKPPSRYTEASLIKKLKKNDIGRPSTYAPILSTIEKRNYIEKEGKKLKPTDVGTVVSNLLVEHFPKIVDVEFTAEMEDDLDKVAEGEKEWTKLVEDFYNPFIENLQQKEENLDKQNILKELDEECPKCGANLVIKLGQKGKFKACSNYPDCEYTAPNKEEKKEQEELIQEFGEETCDECGADMELKKGKYGYFWGCSNYPECKNTKKLKQKTDFDCPKCEDGKLVKMANRDEEIFYGCSNYPDCEFGTNHTPLDKTCPECDTVLLEAETKIFCPNQECDYQKKKED